MATKLTGERLELHNINKKLNRRLLTAERSNKTFLKGYQEVKGILSESGYGTVSKSGNLRFKERVAKLSDAQVKEALKYARRAERITSYTGRESTKLANEGYKRIKKALDKSGIVVKDAKSFGVFANDFFQFVKTETYKRMLDYFASEEIQEMAIESGKNYNTIGNLFNSYCNRCLDNGVPFDPNEFRFDILI